MKSSHLYLLVERGGLAFKIGKADDPTRRSANLPNRIDYTRSLAFAFPAIYAMRAEKSLHFLFRASRITGRPKEDGSTEWFDMAAFEQVKRFLWVNRQLLGWTDWSLVQPPSDRPGRPLADDSHLRGLNRAEKAALQAEIDLAEQQRKERAARLSIANAEMANATRQALEERGLRYRSPRSRKAWKARSGPVVHVAPDRGQ